MIKWIRRQIMSFFHAINRATIVDAQNALLEQRLLVLTNDNEALRRDFLRLVDINMVVTGRIPINDPGVTKEFGYDAPPSEEGAEAIMPSRISDLRDMAQKAENMANTAFERLHGGEV